METTNNTLEELKGPSAQMKKLFPLIGTWKLSGDSQGTVKYESIAEGFFLMQTIDIQVFGHNVRGIEMIGHLQPFMQSPSEEVYSRSYDNSGNTFDFIYELEGDTLTIWGGAKDSSSYFKGKFNEDFTVNTGAWVYPGGGYQSTMTKIK
jgi:hypothetical protein